MYTKVLMNVHTGIGRGTDGNTDRGICVSTKVHMDVYIYVQMSIQ